MFSLQMRLLVLYVLVVAPSRETFCLQSLHKAYLESSSSEKKDQIHDFLLALLVATSYLHVVGCLLIQQHVLA